MKKKTLFLSALRFFRKHQKKKKTSFPFFFFLKPVGTRKNTFLSLFASGAKSSAREFLVVVAFFVFVFFVLMTRSSMTSL